MRVEKLHNLKSSFSLCHVISVSLKDTVFTSAVKQEEKFIVEDGCELCNTRKSLGKSTFSHALLILKVSRKQDFLYKYKGFFLVGGFSLFHFGKLQTYGVNGYYHHYY